MVVKTGVGAYCGDACCHPQFAGESRTGALLSAFPYTVATLISNSEEMLIKCVTAWRHVFKFSSFAWKEVTF